MPAWQQGLAQGYGWARFDPYQRFNFFVELEGLIVGGFTKLTGLSSEIEVESVREGGVNGYVRQFPGQARQGKLTLEHGLALAPTLWNWHYQATQGVIQRKNGTILLLDERSMPRTMWTFRNAFPSRWTGPEFDASSSEIAFESVELVHEGLKRPGGLLGDVALAAASFAVGKIQGD